MHLLLVVRYYPKYTQLCRNCRDALLHDPELLWKKQNEAISSEKNLQSLFYRKASLKDLALLP